MNRGILYGFGAYLMWGVLPIFWKQLQSLPAFDVAAHRIIWSFALLAVIVSFVRKWDAIRQAIRKPRTLATFAIIAAILFLNWMVYIWAINAGKIVETSLGYFINPLVNVLLGVLFLRERLRSFQWLAIAVAASGVLWLTVRYGSLPWIALTLAFTFGIYGLLKKKSSLESLEGLTLEMGILVAPVLLFLAYRYTQTDAITGFNSLRTAVLLLLTGVFTVAPLLMFGAGARRIPLSVVGLLQYIAPTIQLLIGVLMYHEPFTRDSQIGFVLIWIALALYTAEGIWRRQHRSGHPAATMPANRPAITGS